MEVVWAPHAGSARSARPELNGKEGTCRDAWRFGGSVGEFRPGWWIGGADGGYEVERRLKVDSGGIESLPRIELEHHLHMGG